MTDYMKILMLRSMGYSQREMERSGIAPRMTIRAICNTANCLGSQLPLNCKKYLRLFHAAFTILHAGLIRHEGGKILLVFSLFQENTDFFSRRFRAFPEQTLSSG